MQSFANPAWSSSSTWPGVVQTVYCLELDLNEAAISLTLVKFAAWPQEGWVLAVGTVQSLTFYPREIKDGFIRLYRCAWPLTPWNCPTGQPAGAGRIMQAQA